MLSRFSLIFLLFLSVFFSCKNDQKNDNKVDSTKISKNGSKVKLVPIMDFKGKNKVDLGTIREGEKIKHTYEFVNTGTGPLQISYANASCGCTVPSWPKAPIPVGGKGAITVEFNSKNKEGKLLKNVSIYSNTVPEFNTVAFSIEVIK
jgi:hypothetical protein